MSYEDEGGDDGGEDRGRLVAIASFFTVHEAELARTKLESEGLVAVLWDAATVNADPLLALALRGVKVAVPERDALRARAILGPLAEVFGGRARPAFRVKGNHGTSGMLVGAVVGVGIAVALSRVVAGALPWIAGVVIAIVGSWWGERRRADTCSSCLHPVRPVGAASADRCPHCEALLRGTIAHVNDRLAAEEALDDDDDDDGEGHLGDADVEDASIPTDGSCHDATDGTASRR